MLQKGTRVGPRIFLIPKSSCQPNPNKLKDLMSDVDKSFSSYVEKCNQCSQVRPSTRCSWRQAMNNEMRVKRAWHVCSCQKRRGLFILELACHLAYYLQTSGLMSCLQWSRFYFEVYQSMRTLPYLWYRVCTCEYRSHQSAENGDMINNKWLYTCTSWILIEAKNEFIVSWQKTNLRERKE